MLVRLYENNPDMRKIGRIVNLLKDGGIVVYPTDTVYAMGCDALNVRAVERICKIKGINSRKTSLSIICDNLSNISEYAKISNSVFKIMRKNLPGAFTFILNATNNLPKIYKNRKEIGIRIPDNNIILTLVKELENPILSASMCHEKSSTKEYYTDPELIKEEYNDIVDVIINGGYGGLEPSTIVDCTGDRIEILRQGKGNLIQ